MTAFASREIQINQIVFNCELKSVNHRYCDINIKLPDAVRASEIDIRRQISNKIKRGKIDCSISLKADPTDGLAIQTDPSSIKKLIEIIHQIESIMEQHAPTNALDILNFPGILQTESIDHSKLQKPINELLSQCIDDLLKSRHNEGLKLSEFLKAHGLECKKLINKAKEYIPEIIRLQTEKIHLRIREVCESPDQDRLEQELVYLIQKQDITEELERLEAHTSELLQRLNDTAPVGRRLDFLMQELNREANTLASKSVDIRLTQIAIDLKVIIEQMREQIQNIE